jgi:exosortase
MAAANEFESDMIKGIYSMIFVTMTVVTVFVVMFLYFPYSTGYGFNRVPLWASVSEGYDLDGGEWGFGRFVPLAVIVLCWISRRELLRNPITPSVYLGGAVLLLGAFIFFAGFKANEKYIGFVSGQILVAGTILWFLGKKWFTASFWVWVLFGLVWPWRFLIEPVSFPLQMVMVKLTAGFLNLIGDPAIANGTAILSAPIEGRELGGRFSLNVAAACSGLRSLFALFMISLLYGFLSLKSGWHRLILLLSVPLMAVMGNFVRMIMLYIGVLTLGAETAIGKGEHDPSTFHLLAGFAVFAVSLFGMTLLVQGLRRGRRGLKKKVVVVKSASVAEG